MKEVINIRVYDPKYAGYVQVPIVLEINMPALAEKMGNKVWDGLTGEAILAGGLIRATIGRMP